MALFQFFVVGNCQLITAFSPAACQHFAAIGSLHSFSEAMHRFLPAVMRLKCTFHQSQIFKNGGQK